MLTGGYPSLWMACASSGVLVPVPEDLPLVWAGIQVADGAWAVLPTLAVAIVGVGCRDLAMWSIGRALGRVLLDGDRGRFLFGRRNLAWAHGFVERHGPKAVLFGRFLVGFRAPVFAAAGAVGVPFRSFVLFDGIGLLVAVPLAVSVGWAFGHPVVALLTGVLAWARAWVAPLVVLTIAVALGTVQWRRSASRRQAAEKVG